MINIASGWGQGACTKIQECRLSTAIPAKQNRATTSTETYFLFDSQAAWLSTTAGSATAATAITELYTMQ
jgi:hypothetical protein